MLVVLVEYEEESEQLQRRSLSLLRHGDNILDCLLCALLGGCVEVCIIIIFVNLGLLVQRLASCLLSKLLRLQKLEKVTALFHKLGVRALLDHAPAAQHNNLIRITNSGEAVGNCNGRSVSANTVKCALDGDLGSCVEGRGRFIE